MDRIVMSVRREEFERAREHLERRLEARDDPDARADAPPSGAEA